MARIVHSNDYDIRALVVRALLDGGIPRDSIRHEITLDSSSSDGRADMVLLFDDRLVGIEIKSGKDTLVRLAEQGPRYAARFDRLVLVADERHRAAIEALPYGHFKRHENTLFAGRNTDGTLTLLPDRWSAGVPILAGGIGAAAYGRSRKLCPFSMLQLLWQKEVAAIVGGSITRHAGIDYCAEIMALRELRKCIAVQLRARQLNRWEEAFWTRFDAPTIAAETGIAA